MRRFFLLVFLGGGLAACGARTELGVHGLGGDGGGTCAAPSVPIVMHHPGADVCALSNKTPGYPALAMLAGQDLFILSSRGVVSHAFHFDVDGGAEPVLRSRGNFLGALVQGSHDAEMVLLTTDGVVLATAHATGTASSEYGVSGNAGGLFLFGVFGSVWALQPSGAVIGPIPNLMVPYLGPDPDGQGRALVLPADTNSAAAFEWLDVCSARTRPATLVNASAWDGALFGLTGGTPQVETAAGVSSVASTLGMGWVYGLTASGVALISLGGQSFVTLDLATAHERTLTLDYGALVPAGGAGPLSDVGTSSNPAGFGVDSLGRVTMFMTDPTGTYLFTTPDGKTWTPMGRPVAWNPSFEPGDTLEYAEAAGTFVIQGSEQGGGLTWQVVSGESDVSLDALPHLSWDGQCAAALEPDGTLTIEQAASGATFSVQPNLGTTTWTPVWLGGDDALFVQY